ncbi:MAG: hypothetical protein HUU29_04785 [Planctomycetaceae bacterium]|nr:hypothetical protein [Planctomycetaceae bacterium]
MDPKQQGVSLDEFISRKLHPVRILVGYLNNEMALNDNEEMRINRNDLESLVSTMEIFIEEFDRVSQQARARSGKKKFTAIDAKTGIKAVA